MLCLGESEAGQSAVALVIGGGPRTFEAAYRAIKAGIPLLVLEGTGIAADVIVAAYETHDQP